jgi:hypothetical protein
MTTRTKVLAAAEQCDELCAAAAERAMDAKSPGELTTALDDMCSWALTARVARNSLQLVAA